MNIESNATLAEQPPLIKRHVTCLTVVVTSLALGGAEKAILDWAMRIYPRWNVHIIALKDQTKEWVVPEFIKVTRLQGIDVVAKLKKLSPDIASESNGICLCHLLKKAERDALIKCGITAIPVLQNAAAGWPEPGEKLNGAPYIISVSNACKEEMRKFNTKKHVSVIHHIPKGIAMSDEAREFFRKQWRIPQEAIVIGMIGAVKPQKNYLLALCILKEMLIHKNVYLVIVGGPIGKHGEATWKNVVSEINTLDLRHRVAMPGFIPHAAQCLPAFDIMLNTSHYEGLSIATLEALVNRVPVVASQVGGQGELKDNNLTLLPQDVPIQTWVKALMDGLFAKERTTPSWAHFPSYRLWTLAHLAKPVVFTKKVLFVTANLNSGGAQRSLVNLTKEINDSVSLQIAVTNNSATSFFYEELRNAGVKVYRTDELSDAFAHTEVLVQKICTEQISTVCFWNLDAKVKLLLVKTLAFTNIKFVDASPGSNSFEEMDAQSEFQQLISYTSAEYYERLNSLVLKYNGPSPHDCTEKTIVIPNGIPISEDIKHSYTIGTAPRIVVSGRMAAVKFLHEIIAAVRIVWQQLPTTELHFYGGAEPKHQAYAQGVLDEVGEENGKRIFFHGFNFDSKSQLHTYDAYVVLGKYQGCPNALLEALSVGMPAIANDDGGTREQIINNHTGILIDSTSPIDLAEALVKILTNRNFAKKIGTTGRQYVLRAFSMKKMAKRYTALLTTRARKKVKAKVPVLI